MTSENYNGPDRAARDSLERLMDDGLASGNMRLQKAVKTMTARFDGAPTTNDHIRDLGEALVTLADVKKRSHHKPLRDDADTITRHFFNQSTESSLPETTEPDDVSGTLVRETTS